MKQTTEKSRKFNLIKMAETLATAYIYIYTNVVLNDKKNSTIFVLINNVMKKQTNKVEMSC